MNRKRQNSVVMGKQRILSSKFNMSLGYIPVIISIILCEFIIQDIAIYIGAGVGVLSSIYMWQRKGPHIPQFILYSTTGMLLLLTITSFFPLIIVRKQCFRLRWKSVRLYLRSSSFWIEDAFWAITQPRPINAASSFCTRSRSRHSIGPCITAHRFPAFSYHIACHIVRASAERYATLHFIPYHAALRIHTGYLVQSVRHILFQQDNESYRICTYRDKKGDVIGKAMASEAINRKNEYINPVIRITVTSHGMLFYCPVLNAAYSKKAKRIY